MSSLGSGGSFSRFLVDRLEEPDARLTQAALEVAPPALGSAPIYLLVQIHSICVSTALVINIVSLYKRSNYNTLSLSFMALKIMKSTLMSSPSSVPSLDVLLSLFLVYTAIFRRPLRPPSHATAHPRNSDASIATLPIALITGLRCLTQYIGKTFFLFVSSGSAFLFW